MILVFVSTENKKDAGKLANHLIDLHMAACVSIIPVESFYFWKGEKVHYNECELIIKTKVEKFSAIEKAISDVLPYEIPQIISINAKDANSSYLKWLEEAVR